MSRDFRRFIFILGILAALWASLRWVAAPAVRSYLSFSPPCSQPCPDARGCQPVALTLELARPRAKLGKRYPLWYKLKLVNQSCFELSIDGAGFFAGGHRILSLSILDSKGREVKEEYPWQTDMLEKKAGTFKMVPYGVPYGPVSPYRCDMTEFRRLIALNRVSDSYIELVPGETLTTQSFVLDPRREVMVEQRFPDGSRGTAGAWVPAPAPSWAEIPPPGFAPLGNYVFRTPGHYRMVAAYRSETSVWKGLPRFEALPRSVRRILGWIEHYLYLDVVPERGPIDLRIDAVSNAVDFEVRP